MTVAAAETTAAPSPPQAPHPAARAAWCVGGDLGIYALFWLGIVAAFVVVMGVLSEGPGNGIGSSLWVDATVPRYIAVAGGVVAATAYVPLLVVHGITRRHAAAGAVPALVVLTVLAAVAITAGQALEAQVYGLAGWPHRLSGEGAPHIFDRPGQYGLVAVEQLAVLVTHLATGWMAGAAFARLGGGGVLLVPVAVLPAVVTETVLGVGVLGRFVTMTFDIDPPPLPAGLAVAAVLGALGLAAGTALVRDAPVPTTTGWWR